MSKIYKISKFVLPIIPAILIVSWILFTKTHVLGNCKKFLLETFQTKHIENLAARENFIGDKQLLNRPYVEDIYELQIKNPPVEIRLPFKKALFIDGLSLFFNGDLDSNSSLSAKHFDLYYKESENTWTLLDTKRNYRKTTYKILFPETLTTEELKIVIYKAAHNDKVQISDLKFLTRAKTSFIEGFFNVINPSQKGILANFTFSLFFLAILIIPGFTLAQKYDSETRLVLAPIFTIIVLSSSTLLFMASQKDIFLYLFLFIFLATAIIFLKKKLYKHLFEIKTLFLIIFVALTITTTLQLQRDYLFSLNYMESHLDELIFFPQKNGYYGYHSDNTRPWGAARAILHNAPVYSKKAEDYALGASPIEIVNRTPLLQIITVPILKVFGESHFIYRRFLTSLAAFYFVNLFVFIRHFFSKPIAITATLMSLINTYLNYKVINTEIYVKFVAIYLIYTGLIFLHKKFKNEKENLAVPTIAMCLAFAMHPMVVIIIPAILILHIKIHGFSKKTLKKYVLTTLPTAIAMSIWAFYSLGFAPMNKNIYMQNSAIPGIGEILKRAKILLTVLIFGTPDGGGNIKQIFIDGNFSVISILTPIVFLVYLTAFNFKNLKKHWHMIGLSIAPFLLMLFISRAQFLGTAIHFYIFVLPIIFAIVAEKTLRCTKSCAFLIYASYVIFNFVNLYRYSWIYNQMRYTSLSVSLFKFMLVLIYLLLGTFLMKHAVFEKNSKLEGARSAR